MPAGYKRDWRYLIYKYCESGKRNLSPDASIELLQAAEMCILAAIQSQFFRKWLWISHYTKIQFESYFGGIKKFKKCINVNIYRVADRQIDKYLNFGPFSGHFIEYHTGLIGASVGSWWPGG